MENIEYAFLDYVPLEEKFSLAANHFAKTCRDPVLAAKMKKAGLVCDTLSTALCNFTPMYQMIDTAITANGDEVTFPPVTELRPRSEGAIRWAQEQGSPLHYRTPAPSQPIEELKPLAIKICLETTKEKELISEPEMAHLLSLPTKTLGNRRLATALEFDL